jgi:hypothetical protein
MCSRPASTVWWGWVVVNATNLSHHARLVRISSALCPPLDASARFTCVGAIHGEAATVVTYSPPPGVTRVHATISHAADVGARHA